MRHTIFSLAVLLSSTFAFVAEFDPTLPLGLQLSGSGKVKVSGFQKDGNGLPQAGELDGRIRIGDVLLKIDGSPVKNVNEVVSFLRKKPTVRVLEFEPFDDSPRRQSSIHKRETMPDLQQLSLISRVRSTTNIMSLVARKSGEFPELLTRIVYANPAHGCGELENESQVRGAIVVVERGVCTFHDKAYNVQYLGALGIVIVNLDDELPSSVEVQKLGGAPIKIGVVLVTSTNGLKIKSVVDSQTNTSPAIVAFHEQGVHATAEFAIERKEKENKYSWWFREYQHQHPEENSCDDDYLHQALRVDATKTTFRRVHVKAAHQVLYDRTYKVPEAQLHPETRAFEGIMAKFGLPVETCVLDCITDAPGTHEEGDTDVDDHEDVTASNEPQEEYALPSLHLNINETVSGILVPLSSPMACEPGEARLRWNENVKVDPEGDYSHGIVFVTVSRGGGCNFDDKVFNVEFAFSKVFRNPKTAPRLFVMVVNSENGLFVIESSAPASSFLSHVMLVPKTLGRTINAVNQLAGESGEVVVATMAVATLKKRTAKQTDQTMAVEISSDVAFGWHEIQRLIDDHTEWAKEKPLRRKQYKSLAQQHHPDKGGSQDRFETLVYAYKRANFFYDRDTGDVESFDDMA